MSRSAAALLQQADALDAHAALERLHHVVDGEAGDRDRGQRFHLHPGPAIHLDACAHVKTRQLALRRNIYGDVRDGQGMAERDQLVGAFCRHDAGEARSPQHVALFGVAGKHEVERFCRHHHAAFCDCHAFGRGLRRHIDHARFAALAEMGELAAFLGRKRIHQVYVERRAPTAAAAPGVLPAYIERLVPHCPLASRELAACHNVARQLG